MVDKQYISDFWPQVFEPLRQMGSRLAEFATPASEASSDDNAYHIALELPGVSEEDIDISVNGGVMIVKGEKKTEREERTDTWYFSERRYGAFSRSFRLPDDADSESITATLKDGVLTVTLPRKAAKQADSQKVQINRG